jgi:hypothetical protein
MTIWHVLLYVGAAILALRSFVQLMTNYKAEYEETAVSAELIRMREEIEADTIRQRQEAKEREAASMT